MNDRDPEVTEPDRSGRFVDDVFTEFLAEDGWAPGSEEVVSRD